MSRNHRQGNRERTCKCMEILNHFIRMGLSACKEFYSCRFLKKKKR